MEWAGIARIMHDWGWRVDVGGDSLLSDDISFQGDGHEDAKMGSNTDPLAPTRPLYSPSESNAGQGVLKRL